MRISANSQNKMRQLAHFIRLDFEGSCKKSDSFKHFDCLINHLTTGLTILYLLKDFNLMANEKPPDRAGKFERPKKNDSCGGTGKTNYPNQKREAICQKCKGTGKVPG
jgi:hypothetical protein